MKVAVFILAALSAVCAQNAYKIKTFYDQPLSVKPFYDKPSYDQPPYGQPSYDKSFYDKSSYDKSSYDKPSYDKPSYDKPSYDKPSYDQPPYGQPSYDKSFYDKSSYDMSSYDKPSYDKPSYDKSSYDKPSYDQPPYDQPSYDQPSYDKPSYDKPSYDKPSYDQPPYGQPSYDKSFYDKSSYDMSSYDKPSYDKPSYDKSSYDKPSYDQPPYDQPSYAQPSYEKSSYDKPSFYKPSNGQPSYDKSSYDKPSYGQPSLDELRLDVENLEQYVRDVEETLATVRTLNQAGQDKINFLVDVFLPKINLMNKQQDARAASYAAQLKAIQLRLDKDEANGDEVLVWAQDTQGTLGHLADFLEQNIKADNDNRDSAIDFIQGEVEAFKEEVLGNLDFNIQELNGELDQARNVLHSLFDFVEDRKCEYGVGYFNPDETKFVPFVTAFAEDPEVSLFVTGFTSDLDGYKDKYNKEYNGNQYDKQYNSYDIDRLSLATHVTHVNMTGFVVSALDLSECSVDVKFIFTSWLACQNLAGDVSYNATDSPIDPLI